MPNELAKSANQLIARSNELSCECCGRCPNQNYETQITAGSNWVLTNGGSAPYVPVTVVGPLHFIADTTLLPPNRSTSFQVRWDVPFQMPAGLADWARINFQTSRTVTGSLPSGGFVSTYIGDSIANPFINQGCALWHRGAASGAGTLTLANFPQPSAGSYPAVVGFESGVLEDIDVDVVGTGQNTLTEWAARYSWINRGLLWPSAGSGINWLKSLCTGIAIVYAQFTLVGGNYVEYDLSQEFLIDIE